MHTTNRLALGLGALTLAAILVIPHTTTAGDLNPPPGAIAPTGRQVVTPIATLPYTISQPGSYVLQGNLQGTAGNHGIVVQSDDVTIDLNGFALIGVSGSGAGIFSDGSLRRNISVFNGAVRDWDQGGVFLNNCRNGSCEGVRAFDNGGPGIRVAHYFRISNCQALDNAGDGIFFDEGSIVVECVASGGGSDGFRIDQGCLVKNCVAHDNNDSGFNVGGAGSLVLECNAFENTEAGFYINGENNRVESCHASANATGFDYTASTDGLNMLVRCSGIANTTQNFATSSGNIPGNTYTDPMQAQQDSWGNINRSP